MSQGRDRGGRPRSEPARAAVLWAVDDLLAKVGYAAMTMKGIAELAGVSRMTVYRWWSTKAEILFEASALDAEEELTVPPDDDPFEDVTRYLEALHYFLTRSHAGAAYRALLGEAQHDPAVAALLAGRDILGDTARAVVSRVAPDADHDRATALLIGPMFFWILSGRDPARIDPADLARTFLAQISPDSRVDG
ncbi:TetR/AcrR family transcriptional regulator [Actinoplanes couchii]|uniref:Transcriptional regulator, TetR family protein n=1 Tax=Actinoplanes couchii TaxID=403638 RepID=A0ABQ3X8Q0_9ACTN|nr:TetR/AcrR family transcriptional regulator [Actinoplanes couchii]MDR6320191.1 AcrR family transcriptional regulator [Actinoplanes couchii]GID54795.1 putative transcriptional regulator, TetR family protein [Actinoplanes couchii]